jgi:methylmalonyl-CoA mutase N-terminal domain/subunit
MQNEIASSAYQYQKDIESGEKIIVGVNAFKEEGELKIPVFKIDQTIQQIQVNKLKAFKENRNNDMVEMSLHNISKAAAGKENLMPLVVHAIEQHCTLGEIADVLRNVFGEYK